MIKPTKFYIDCGVICPSCGCEQWWSLDEILNQKKYICPHCKHKTKWCQHVSTDIVFAEPTKKTKSPPKDELPFNLKEWVDALSGLGYKKPEAKKKILANAHLYTNDEDFLQCLLQT